MTKIGIIGGSGLDNPDILENAVDQSVTTRWGTPSSPLKQGRIAGVDVILLGRHGREHTVTPTQVNYRANVQALKDAGCTHMLATTAVKAEMISRPVNDVIRVNETTLTIYMKAKASTAKRIGWGATWPPIRTL